MSWLTKSPRLTSVAAVARLPMLCLLLLVTLLVFAAPTTHALSAANYTTAERTNTLAFLQGFISANPGLGIVWSKGSSDDFCTWTYISCNSTSVALLDFQATGAPAIAVAAVLPELGDDVDGSAVIFTGIRASGMGSLLSGSLPSSWGRLTRLQVLHLNDNALTGTLPAAWSGMSSLYGLRLDGNGFSGTVPAEWSALEQFS